ncbi:hypothetical protein SAMN06265368_2938 [Cohaesibacter gelatinilyticus]|uniref:Uncharacterized protein n=1 Tax=Cohaesibacter gelatinilyticus TaxID=372072 RepID=A0A285PEX7_9HYPH|nr:hypothetical protein SAMN06265368_2938 [Cohaesibacter gelatinilyticus]
MVWLTIRQQGRCPQSLENRPLVLINDLLNIVIFLGKCPGIVRRKLPCQQAIDKHPMCHCFPPLVLFIYRSRYGAI